MWWLFVVFVIAAIGVIGVMLWQHRKWRQTIEGMAGQVYQETLDVRGEIDHKYGPQDWT